MISLPKWLITRPRKLPNASDPLKAPMEQTPSSHSVGTNIENPVVDTGLLRLKRTAVAEQGRGLQIAIWATSTKMPQ